MAVDLTGVTEKVKRANEHIKELDRRIGRFEKSDPYLLLEQPHLDDPEKIQHVFRIRKPIPAGVSLAAGDAIHNLRAALDHLVCAAVGSKVTSDTAFPIWRSKKNPTPSAQDYKSLIKSKAKGAPEAFIGVLESLQPYEGGNHESLWALDYLDITDKHRLLISAFGTYRQHHTTVGPLTMIMTLDEPRFPLEDGDVLFETRLDSQQQDQASIEVALGEPRILKGEPLVPALTDLVEATTDIINQLSRVL